jgi:hypothetical protein
LEQNASGALSEASDPPNTSERVDYGLFAFALTLITLLLASSLARAAAGDLDRSFSGNGKVRTDFGSRTYSVAIDSRDRIVAAGNALDHRSDFALARYIGYRRR